ncbi:MAG: tetratricopeptide repeat protein [Flavobacteriaceae bacterium]|nr:tetratricopeptide repeat protein [Flavobacteriaceae bacterium]
MTRNNHSLRKVILGLFMLLSCGLLTAQNQFTATQWQEDLKFLQEQVHQEYQFLFKKITAEEFDASVDELHKAIPTMADHEVFAGLTRIVSSFKYGHTRMGFRDSPVKLTQLPIAMYQFSDGMYVQGVHKDYPDALGAKVVAIEGVPIDKVMEAIYPLVPSENDQFFKAYGVLYATSPELLHAQGVTDSLKKSIQFTLKKEGKEFRLLMNTGDFMAMPMEYGYIKRNEDWLQVRDSSATPLYLKNLDKIYYYEYLPEEKTVYVRQSQIQDDPSEDIPSFYAKVFDFIENNDVEKMVLDVRLNGGGNNYKNKPVVTGIVRTEKINQPGKLFVIIGRRTFSACQNLINELSNYTNAIFVGEPSSENINFYGDNREVQLPNTKIKTYLSFAWWQDKPQWENGDWTAPQLAVESSFEEYRNNEDPVLDTALSFKDDNFIIDPMAHLTNLFMSGNTEQLEADAVSLVQDPKYRFFDFEGEFNKAGYRLLEGSQLEEAVYVFTMNTQMFPDSANAWDSLAEGYWKAGDLEKATEYYNKAIQLDPTGSVGDNARSMLEKMKKGDPHN